jgi:hypothetical protein
MKTGIEVYISIVLITIMAVLCSSFMIADVKAADARDAYYSYYTAIDNSDCAESIVNACISDAGDNGYKLTVEEIGHETSSLYKVTFIWNYKVTVVGVNTPHTIVGYVQG